MDLVIVNPLEGLLGPRLFILSHEVLHWNMANPFVLNKLFYFYTIFLHDGGTLFIFNLNDPKMFKHITINFPTL